MKCLTMSDKSVPAFKWQSSKPFPHPHKILKVTLHSKEKPQLPFLTSPGADTQGRQESDGPQKQHKEQDAKWHQQGNLLYLAPLFCQWFITVSNIFMQATEIDCKPKKQGCPHEAGSRIRKQAKNTCVLQELNQWRLSKGMCNCESV